MTEQQQQILAKMAYARPMPEGEKLFDQLREAGYGDRERSFGPYPAAPSPTGERLWVCHPDPEWLAEIGYTAPEPIPPTEQRQPGGTTVDTAPPALDPEPPICRRRFMG